MKSKLILVTLAIVIGGGLFFSVTNSYAQNNGGQYPSIIQRLVERFNLKESDVQAVFDENRKDRQAQMQVRFEEKLNQAVKDGKLTEAQKQLILEKHKELQTKKQEKPANWQDMTPDERRNFSQTNRQELEDWAEKNGVDLQYFLGGFKGKMGGGWNHKW